MRVLVLGGTGLISTAITRGLLQRGDDVWLYNRGQTKTYAPSRPAVAHLITGDRKDAARFERQVSEHAPFDAVIDMIAFSAADAESISRALRGRAGHLVVCSTCDVYRRPASRYPYREDEPLEGISAYSVGKVQAERAFMAAHVRGDFPVTIIRPAFTYGEGRGPICTWGRSPSYLDRIRRGRPIVVHGDGSTLVSACHRDDVGAAFVAACGRSGTFGKAYHATGEDWMTWDSYHRQVAEALGAPEPSLVHIPTDVLRVVAPERSRITAELLQFHSIFDTTLARTDLGFADRVSWQDGVRRMVQWLDEHHAIEDCDLDPFDDRLVSTWQHFGASLAGSLS